MNSFDFVVFVRIVIYNNLKNHASPFDINHNNNLMEAHSNSTNISRKSINLSKKSEMDSYRVGK